MLSQLTRARLNYQLLAASQAIHSRPLQMPPRFVPRTMLSAPSRRAFSNITNNAMSLPEAQKLHELMEDFERNPKNMEATYLLFRELNRHGMYLTVIRLYHKHNLASVTDKTADLMKSQFEYAKDNIQQFKKDIYGEKQESSQQELPFYAQFINACVKIGFTLYLLYNVL